MIGNKHEKISVSGKTGSYVTIAIAPDEKKDLLSYAEMYHCTLSTYIRHTLKLAIDAEKIKIKNKK